MFIVRFLVVLFCFKKEAIQPLVSFLFFQSIASFTIAVCYTEHTTIFILHTFFRFFSLEERYFTGKFLKKFFWCRRCRCCCCYCFHFSSIYTHIFLVVVVRITNTVTCYENILLMLFFSPPLSIPIAHLMLLFQEHVCFL